MLCVFFLLFLSQTTGVSQRPTGVSERPTGVSQRPTGVSQRPTGGRVCVPTMEIGAGGLRSVIDCRNRGLRRVRCDTLLQVSGNSTAPGVAQIRLSDNRLASAGDIGCLRAFTGVSAVDLSGNELTAARDFLPLKDLPSLKTLIITRTKMTFFNSTGLDTVESLNLSQNHLLVQFLDLQSLVNLQTMDISSTGLCPENWRPEIFLSLTKLQTLRMINLLGCPENGVMFSANSLKGLGSVSHLELTPRLGSTIGPGLSGSVPSLRKLRLLGSSCGLSHLSSNFSSDIPTGITELVIHACPLQSVSLDFLVNFSSLKYLAVTCSYTQHVTTKQLLQSLALSPSEDLSTVILELNADDYTNTPVNLSQYLCHKTFRSVHHLSLGGLNIENINDWPHKSCVPKLNKLSLRAKVWDAHVQSLDRAEEALQIARKPIPAKYLELLEESPANLQICRSRDKFDENAFIRKYPSVTFTSYPGIRSSAEKCLDTSPYNLSNSDRHLSTLIQFGRYWFNIWKFPARLIRSSQKLASIDDRCSKLEVIGRLTGDCEAQYSVLDEKESIKFLGYFGSIENETYNTLRLASLPQSKIFTINVRNIRYAKNIIHLLTDKMKRLRVLDLPGNMLTGDKPSQPTLMDLQFISKLPSLELINLQNNPLRTFYVNFTLLTALKKLNLHGCQFEGISGATLESFMKLEVVRGPAVTLDLTNNPFECSCNYFESLKWIKSSRTTIVDKNKLRCRTEDEEIPFNNEADRICKFPAPFPIPSRGEEILRNSFNVQNFSKFLTSNSNGSKFTTLGIGKTNNIQSVIPTRKINSSNLLLETSTRTSKSAKTLLTEFDEKLVLCNPKPIPVGLVIGSLIGCCVLMAVCTYSVCLYRFKIILYFRKMWILCFKCGESDSAESFEYDTMLIYDRNSVDVIQWVMASLLPRADARFLSNNSPGALSSSLTDLNEVESFQNWKLNVHFGERDNEACSSYLRCLVKGLNSSRHALVLVDRTSIASKCFKNSVEYALTFKGNERVSFLLLEDLNAFDLPAFFVQVCRINDLTLRVPTRELPADSSATKAFWSLLRSQLNFGDVGCVTCADHMRWIRRMDEMDG